MTRVHWMMAALLSAACGSSTLSQSSGSGDADDSAELCPAARPAPEALPGIEAKHRQASYWVERAHEADTVLLTPSQIDDHGAAFAARDAAHPADDPLAPYDLSAPEERDRLERELRERLSYLRERVADGRYLDAEGKQVALDAFESGSPPDPRDEVRVALADIPLRCGPRLEGLYLAPELDHAFDRNACSTLRAQEPVKILGTWRGMKLARTRYALGFLAAEAPLSPPLVPADLATFAGTRAYRLDTATSIAGQRLPAHTRLPRRGDKALVATATGVEEVSAPAAAVATERPLTRRALFEEAFRYLDGPYGWGGQ